jgi:Na+/H+-dicarboxylate symporter
MTIAKNTFKKLRLPITLLCILLAPLLLGDLVPVEVKSFFLAISLSIKAVIIVLIPFIVFSFLFHSLISLKNGAISFIIMLLSLVAISNFIASLTGYTVGSLVLPFFDLTMAKPTEMEALLTPLWTIHLPKLISNEFALIAGIILGINFALRPHKTAVDVATKLNHYAMQFLKKVFVPLLPIFILGFVFKLEHDKQLQKVLQIYSSILFTIVGTQICYIAMIYMVAAQTKLHKFFTYLRNISPATITGFTTISSAATIPVTIMCTEKNLNNSTLARTLIPATANIHTLGSAIGLTIMSMGTLIAFGYELPNLATFLQFACYYTISMFAVAGVPGGVVIVAAPLLEAYLGFNAEMIGLITAIYMLFDPFGTATNVTCNGAFAIIFSKIYKAKEPLTISSTAASQDAVH